MYFTTSIVLVAGICAGVGVLFLIAGLRRPVDRAQNLLLSLFAFLYAASIMSARAAFLAEDLEGFELLFRVSALPASAGFITLLWFVTSYTGIRWKVPLYAITGALGVLGLATAMSPVDFGASAEPPSRITLPWGETVFTPPSDLTLLAEIWTLAILAMVAYIAIANLVQYRRGDRLRAGILSIGLVWFAFTIIEEAFVQVNDLDFVVLSDFGFLGFVVAMSIYLTNQILDSERELRALRANLETTVADRTRELEEAQDELLRRAEDEAATAERDRLARELHDVVTQLLFSINLLAGSLPRLWERDPETAARTTEELQRLTRGAIAEMRTLLRELRPRAIVETNLGNLITQLTEGLAARHDIPADIRVAVDDPLPPQVHVVFYRVAQEALNNVAKHADASLLRVEVVSRRGQAHLSIEDDGIGLGDRPSHNGSMGIAIMHERASAVDADLAFTSVDGHGTTVELDWRRTGSGDN